MLPDMELIGVLLARMKHVHDLNAVGCDTIDQNVIWVSDDLTCA
jgi:hypothetical protein